jgi:hypothetical protein
MQPSQLLPAFEMNAHQEAEFHLSIYHYFLWKATQCTSRAEDTEPRKQNDADKIDLSHNDAVEAQENESNQENHEPSTLTVATLIAGNDATSISRSITPPDVMAEQSDTGNASSSPKNNAWSYQLAADIILQQFPQHVHFFTNLFLKSRPFPPIITTLYKDYPRLQTDLTAAKNRIGQLETELMSKGYENVNLVNELTRIKFQVSCANAPVTGTTKRKGASKVPETNGKRPRASNVATPSSAADTAKGSCYPGGCAGCSRVSSIMAVISSLRSLCLTVRFGHFGRITFCRQREPESDTVRYQCREGYLSWGPIQSAYCNSYASVASGTGITEKALDVSRTRPGARAFPQREWPLSCSEWSWTWSLGV